MDVDSLGPSAKKRVKVDARLARAHVKIARDANLVRGLVRLVKVHVS